MSAICTTLLSLLKAGDHMLIQVSVQGFWIRYEVLTWVLDVLVKTS
jgi:cystathionine beta-lyase/cystathionine gamma-synthase